MATADTARTWQPTADVDDADGDEVVDSAPKVKKGAKGLKLGVSEAKGKKKFQARVT